MREEKGPGRKINGLFCWTAKDSLILHEVAKAVVEAEVAAKSALDAYRAALAQSPKVASEDQPAAR
jgi:hypothetical protein